VERLKTLRSEGSRLYTL